MAPNRSSSFQHWHADNRFWRRRAWPPRPGTGARLRVVNAMGTTVLAWASMSSIVVFGGGRNGPVARWYRTLLRDAALATPVVRHRNDGAIVLVEQRAELGLANARRILQHRVEHRLQLAGRAGDDLQHLARRGLLLQRLAEIVRALAQFLQQRVFSMAMTACAAKFCTSSICLSVNGRTCWRSIPITPDSFDRSIAIVQHRMNAPAAAAPPPLDATEIARLGRSCRRTCTVLRPGDRLVGDVLRSPESGPAGFANSDSV